MFEDNVGAELAAHEARVPHDQHPPVGAHALQERRVQTSRQRTEQLEANAVGVAIELAGPSVVVVGQLADLKHA